jgi:predicted ATPase
VGKKRDAGVKKPQLVLVGGASAGTGKSHLVNAALTRCTRDEKGGFLVRGKFDQCKKGSDDAFSQVLEALTELCEIIDCFENKDQVIQGIKASLGEDLKLFTQFLPALRKLVVEEENDDSIDGEDASVTSSYGRFSGLCCKMIQEVASKEKPVRYWSSTTCNGLIWIASKSFVAYSSARR